MGSIVIVDVAMSTRTLFSLHVFKHTQCDRPTNKTGLASYRFGFYKSFVRYYIHCLRIAAHKNIVGSLKWWTKKRFKVKTNLWPANPTNFACAQNCFATKIVFDSTRWVISLISHFFCFFLNHRERKRVQCFPFSLTLMNRIFSIRHFKTVLFELKPQNSLNTNSNCRMIIY